MRKSELFLAPIALNSTSGRPILLTGEAILFTQRNVGLYDGYSLLIIPTVYISDFTGKRNDKMLDHNDGIAHITTHRIIWIDSEVPEEKAIALSLACLHSWESTVRRSQ